MTADHRKMIHYGFSTSVCGSSISYYQNSELQPQAFKLPCSAFVVYVLCSSFSYQLKPLAWECLFFTYSRSCLPCTKPIGSLP